MVFIKVICVVVLMSARMDLTYGSKWNVDIFKLALAIYTLYLILG